MHSRKVEGGRWNGAMVEVKFKFLAEKKSNSLKNVIRNMGLRLSTPYLT
jgi:hypothetical protein